MGTIGDENEVDIWDPWTGKLVRKIRYDASGLIEMANGEIVTQCFRNETILRIWDQKTGTSIRTLKQNYFF